jgi:hypothetical protein
LTALPRPESFPSVRPRSRLSWTGLPRSVLVKAWLPWDVVFPARTGLRSVGSVGLSLSRRVLSVPGAWPTWSAWPASGLSWSLADEIRPPWRGAVESARARAARGYGAAALRNPSSVWTESVFRSGRADAGRALRPRAAARRARPGTAAGHGVFRTLPRAGKGALVARPLPGRPRRVSGARRRGAFRAGTRGPGGHVRRARAAVGVGPVAGIDGVRARIQVCLVRVTITVRIHGVRGPSLRAPAGSAVPTIHPVPPGHCLFSGAPRQAASHGKPRVPGAGSRNAALAPSSSVGRPEPADRAGRVITPFDSALFQRAAAARGYCAPRGEGYAGCEGTSVSPAPTALRR